MYTLTLLGEGVRKHIFTDVKPSDHTSDNRITQGYDCLAQPAWPIFFPTVLSRQTSEKEKQSMKMWSQDLSFVPLESLFQAVTTE